ncbi:hypothetical protein QYM36_016497 [Artemia franciscana]|uniref:Uncharacterized protein n=1 Tax=Artemia franciscana TaxID=6661 RepID=A0AA88HIU1_ARTSF|nr:hypothetical protein QYM36_016497 [Artemia franciscana]
MSAPSKKRHRAFEQFPCLACVSSDLQDKDFALYGEYLENIHEDMQTRFSDLLGMDIPIWVSIPFEVNVAEINISLQESHIELQSDEIMRAKFKDRKYNIRKTNEVAAKYPFHWDKAQFYVIVFPTSYLVEAGFCRIKDIILDPIEQHVYQKAKYSTIPYIDDSETESESISQEDALDDILSINDEEVEEFDSAKDKTTKTGIKSAE